MFLKFLIFFGFIIYVSSVHYCDVQDKMCKHVKHLRCRPDEIIDEAEKYELYEMNDVIKEMILNKLNEYRDEFARGLTNYTTGAANMRKVTWDTDLQEMAELLVLKNTYAEVCICTIEYPKPFSIALHIDNRKDIDFSINAMIDYMTQNNLNASIYANNNRIGCGIIKLINLPGHKITCILPEHSRRRLEDNYIGGEICTKCTADEICDSTFKGLCAK